MEYLLHHNLINATKKYPDKDAVIFEDDRLTYRELDIVTNQLAKILIKNGVKKGDRVGILINKSIPSIVSIHGILKAGAVYVPLDANAPLSRISYIIDNCQLKCLLTSTVKLSALQSIIQDVKSLDVIILTDDKNSTDIDLPVRVIEWESVRSYSDKGLPDNSTINTDLAYILYTSGSTGVPKGVMISHLNSLTFVNWVCESYDIGSEDRLSNHAPLHFDLSILDIFVAFKAGATLVLVPEKLSMFPAHLTTWIEDNEITVWYSVPSILSMMVIHGKLENHDFKKLRIIFFAGEVFPVKYLRVLMKYIPHAQYINLYGPTETNVITHYTVSKIPEKQTKPIPIGIPCNNMDVFAIQENDKIVSRPGEKGELYARGSCLAQGYWADLEETKKKFIANHMQHHFHEIVYKTGDLVTLDKNGNYIYMGRKDHMIKSRGYRIELGEIEATLYTHSEIKEAAVIAIPDDLITNRIKAFLVLRDGKKINAADMRIYCSNKLPKYMIPEIIVFRDSLPKTSTGKIDKTHLLKESA